MESSSRTSSIMTPTEALSVRFWQHDLLQESRCAVCGRAHEEQYVVAALYFHNQFSGSVCPYCLNHKPAELSDMGSVPEFDEELRKSLASLTDWPISLSDLQDAEAKVVANRFPLLASDDVQRIVGDRYTEYLNACESTGE